MSIKASALIACFEEALSLGCPYVTPGTTDWSRIAEGVDCSGLFAAAFRHLGGSICHGSNTIARKHTAGLSRMEAAALRCGQAVFKWQKDGAPDRYTGDGLGNFHHIGLVCSVKPLRIIHASSATGRVTVDTQAGRWQYAAWLSVVTDDMSEGRKETDMTELKEMTLRVTAASLRIRAQANTAAQITGRLRKGDTVLADAAENGWYRLADGSGWVCGTYVTAVTATQTAEDGSALAERLAALEKRVALLEEAIA